MKRRWDKASRLRRKKQWKGRTWSPETTFKPGHPVGRRFQKGFIPWNKGKKHSEKSIEKMRKAQTGKKVGARHWNWKGGISPLNNKIRNSIEYKLWHKAVLKRDNYSCRFCGKKGGRLQVDHIKPFAYFPELRFAIDNGRTLCENCHSTTDTYKSRAKNNVSQNPRN